MSFFPLRPSRLLTTTGTFQGQSSSHTVYTLTAMSRRDNVCPIMRNRRFILFALILCLLIIPSKSYSFDGPLRVKNQFPLFIHIMPLGLYPASVENSFSVGLSHSSVFVVENSPDWSVGLDMEITELDFRYRRDIPDLFEIGIDVPLISFNSGFMDGFLESYHDTFGFPDYGRSRRPKNEFLYEVQRDGRTVIKGENGGIGLGDIRLSLKKQMLSGDPVLSVMVEVDLPTGSASKGYGSGGVDTGVRILIDKQLGGHFRAYGNAGIVFPGKLDAREEISLKTFFHGGAGIEASYWKNLSFLVQAELQSSPFPDTGIREIDDTAVILSLGGRYATGTGNFELSLTEDPNTAGAPDFTLNLTYTRKL
jgi:hypothetical protein